MSTHDVSWETDLAGLGAEARDLTGALGTTFFDTWEWLSCAAATLAPGRSLHVLCVRRQGALVACVPVTWGRERLHGIPVRSVRLLGDPLADRVTLLVSPDRDLLCVVLDALAAFPQRWDAILLTELLTSPDLREVVDRWAGDRGARIHWRHCARSPVLPLRHRTVEALRGSYSRTLATRLRRSRRRLEGAGAVSFERWRPRPEDVPALLDAFKAIEDASWKGRDGVGIFSPEPRYRFFQDLSRAAAERGWLDVGLLRLDGRLISYRYGFRFRDAYLDYNLAYHPDFARLSPGRVLLDEMIASSLEAGLAAVDASRGSLRDPHQLGEWTDEHVDHHELWILSRRPRGHLLAVLREALRPAVHRIRRRLGGALGRGRG